jgi:hypothetical protein
MNNLSKKSRRIAILIAGGVGTNAGQLSGKDRAILIPELKP